MTSVVGGEFGLPGAENAAWANVGEGVGHRVDRWLTSPAGHDGHFWLGFHRLDQDEFDGQIFALVVCFSTSPLLRCFGLSPADKAATGVSENRREQLLNGASSIRGRLYQDLRGYAWEGRTGKHSLP